MKSPETSDVADPVDRLVVENQKHLANFGKHRLFSMAQGGLLDGEEPRRRFFDCFQIWSNQFQRMLLVRSALTEQPIFQRLAERHLADELGHHTLLKQTRTAPRALWDAQLEAACAWFPWKISTSDDLERLVLVHLVVEASSAIFYERMGKIFAVPEGIAHCQAHAGELDAEHVKMGLAVLRETPVLDVERLLRSQRQGWQMLQTVMSRIADLAQV